MAWPSSRTNRGLYKHELLKRNHKNDGNAINLRFVVASLVVLDILRTVAKMHMFGSAQCIESNCNVTSASYKEETKLPCFNIYAYSCMEKKVVPFERHA